MKKFFCIILILILGTCICRADTPYEVDALVKKTRQGNTRAMCNLALAYFHGNGVLKDPFKAKCWVQKTPIPGAENLFHEKRVFRLSTGAEKVQIKTERINSFISA